MLTFQSDGFENSKNCYDSVDRNPDLGRERRAADRKHIGSLIRAKLGPSIRLKLTAGQPHARALVTAP
jgi:hypothetical protein